VSRSQYQAVAEQLLVDTGASRTTVRIDVPGEDFPVVAEAVRHGAQKIRGRRAVSDIRSTAPVQYLEREQTILVQNDVEHAEPAVPEALVESYGVRAQILAPLVRHGGLAGVISVHDIRGPRQWSETEISALGKAQTRVLALLDSTDGEGPLRAPGELQDAAVQAILDRLLELLAVDRCTLRQDVLPGYAFPVTHESRASEAIRSLQGDFTIVQSGQPVIEKLLQERRQVVQEDSPGASPDHAFQAMLAHYGGLCAQIVTPIFRGDDLVAVVSIHQLDRPRAWTEAETNLAATATRLIGALVHDSS
jgi:GAF domain-containing protein